MGTPILNLDINNARSVAARGETIICDYIATRNMQYAKILDFLPNGCEREMQKFGDVIIFDKQGRVNWVEIKVEEENRHGNFFVETLSNKNTIDIKSHYERASTPGWLYSSKSEYIFYYFLNSDELYILRLFQLKKWLLGEDNKNDGHFVIDRYKEKPQNKYVQKNDTWGRCVPIADVFSNLSPNDRWLVHPQNYLSELNESQIMRAAE